MTKTDFDREFATTKEKLSFLDNLQQSLAFPRNYTKSRQKELPLMYVNYSEAHKLRGRCKMWCNHWGRSKLPDSRNK